MCFITFIVWTDTWWGANQGTVGEARGSYTVSTTNYATFASFAPEVLGLDDYLCYFCLLRA
ncbi:hypothetical protein D3C86_1850920 [compost metagenome]